MKRAEQEASNRVNGMKNECDEINLKWNEWNAERNFLRDPYGICGLI